MKIFMHGFPGLAVVIAFSLLAITACGSSSSDGLSLEDIPRYPNAAKQESMGQSSFGVVGAKLEQYATDDSYDKVLKFYTDALKKYDTKMAAYTIEPGRQAAISIESKDNKLTVAIQELKAEGKVVITLMWLGKGG